MSEQAGTVMSPEPSGFGDNLAGMLNVFVDPASTAKRVPRPWFWLPPFAILSVVVAIVSWMISPIAMDVMRKYPPSENLTGENLERAIRIAGIVTKVQAFASPIVLAVIIALLAWLVVLFCSMLGIRTKFRDVFTLMCACSLITAVGAVAGFFVVRAKADEIQSMQQLAPSFGLDLFFPDLKGPLYALLNFFSLFQVWYLIVLGLGLAYLTGTTKGKAFAAITPAWLLPLIFKLIGAAFSKQ